MLFLHINGNADGFASDVLDNGRTTPDMIDPIAQYDTHHEGHSVIGGFVYQGSLLNDLKKRYIFGDFALFFKFPSGAPPLRTAIRHGHRRPQQQPPGDQQLHVLPGGALSLALLGFGRMPAVRSTRSGTSRAFLSRIR
jgi:hypothetical protein